MGINKYFSFKYIHLAHYVLTIAHIYEMFLTLVTLIFRPFLSFKILSVLASPDATDALLKKVGSEYLFKQDPEPPGSNLK